MVTSSSSIIPNVNQARVDAAPFIKPNVEPPIPITKATICIGLMLALSDLRRRLLIIVSRSVHAMLSREDKFGV